MAVQDTEGVIHQQSSGVLKGCQTELAVDKLHFSSNVFLKQGTLYMACHATYKWLLNRYAVDFNYRFIKERLKNVLFMHTCDNN